MGNMTMTRAMAFIWLWLQIDSKQQKKNFYKKNSKLFVKNRKWVIKHEWNEMMGKPTQPKIYKERKN